MYHRPCDNNINPTPPPTPSLLVQGTLILQFRSLPNKAKTLHCSIDGLELFSCSLSNEEESALSILDPVSVTMEIKPPDVHSRRSALTQKSSLVDAMCTQTLEVCVCVCVCRSVRVCLCVCRSAYVDAAELKVLIRSQ